MHLPLWKGRTWQDANIKLAILSQAVTLAICILPAVGGCSLAERKLFGPKSVEYFWVTWANISGIKRHRCSNFQVFFVVFCLLVLLALWASQDQHKASGTRNKYKNPAFTLFRLFLHRYNFFVNSESLYIDRFTFLLNSRIWIWVFKQNIKASNGQQGSQQAN